MVMALCPIPLIPMQVSGHRPSYRFRWRQGKVVAEDGMTLHSHWFSGPLRTPWYCTKGGPGGREGSIWGGGHHHLPWCCGEKAEQQDACLGSSSVVSSCVTTGDRFPLCIPILSPAVSAGLDSMFTEPSFSPRLIDWCRLKPKTSEVFLKTLLNPQSFPPFAGLDVSLESWKQSLTFPYAAFNSLLLISPQKVRKLCCAHAAHTSHI